MDVAVATPDSVDYHVVRTNKWHFRTWTVFEWKVYDDFTRSFFLSFYFFYFFSGLVNFLSLHFSWSINRKSRGTIYFHGKEWWKIVCLQC